MYFLILELLSKTNLKIKGGKDMRVVLMKDVEKLGKEGDVIEVKPGYARNYLLPKKLAVEATPANLKLAEKKRAERLKREQEKINQMKSLAEKLNEVKLTFYKKAGEKNRLFGSVTSKDIVEALQNIYNIELDKKNIHLEHPIKELGKFEVEVHLYEDINTKIIVEVEPLKEEETKEK